MREVREGKGGINAMEGDLAWGGGHTMQYMGGVL